MVHILKVPPGPDRAFTKTVQAVGDLVPPLLRMILTVIYDGAMNGGFHLACGAIFGLALLPANAVAEELPAFGLVIESHRFTPAELRVPAGRKFRLVVENRDPAPEEFESYDFNREKIVPARGRITLFVGPLKPGHYAFFGEFNPATARGVLVAE